MMTSEKADAGGRSAQISHGVLLENLPAAAVLLDTSGDVRLVNHAARALSPAVDLTPGANVADTRLGRAIPELSNRIRRAAQLGEACGPLECRPGSPGAGVLRVTILPLAARDRPEVLLVLEDRDALLRLRRERDELAAQYEDARRRLLALERGAAHNEFLAMLAHELRNPLAAIVNALEIIRRRTGGDRLLEHAREIAARQARHQARLLDDLLDVSRLVLGKVPLHRTPTDLVAVVQQAVDGLEVIAQTRAHRVDVRVPAEKLLIHGDATRLEQVARNLLANAVKYTPEGGVITVALERDADAAVLTVRDTGIGIKAELLDRIFELFVQGETTLARTQGGLGIGLTLVRRVVELHGGTVRAHSAGPQRGSEFEVRLPLAPGAPAADAGPQTPMPPRRIRDILLIEDNRDVRDAFRFTLELEGYRVRTARDSRAGLRLATSTAPDVVVVDIGLPGIDGYDLARRIRKHLGRSARLVAVTGYGSEEARARALASGFDVFLVKPVTAAQLLRALA
jgi:two-component system, sensor histidine kinase